MADVFVSHRGDDLVDARRLAADLQLRGHRVWLDEWRIDIGDSIVAQINSALDSTTYLVLCYSNKGVDSPWMSREWMSALARQLSGVNIRILPVRLSGGKPPAFLSDIKYADLTADWNTGLDQLCVALG